MQSLSRRRLLQSAPPGALLGSGLLSACTSPASGIIPLAPIRARPDRIIDIAVCTRPLRAAGPRLDSERIGDTLVVHNYGHGGSGWTLAPGSAQYVVGLVEDRRTRGDVLLVGDLRAALLALPYQHR